MKLLIVIVNNDDAKAVSKALVKNRFYSTKLASTGNFLLSGNTTMLVENLTYAGRIRGRCACSG